MDRENKNIPRPRRVDRSGVDAASAAWYNTSISLSPEERTLLEWSPY